MFNLLPESIKDEIRKEYRLRLSIVILSFVIAIQISFLVFLFPSWLVSFYKEKDLLVKSDEANQAIISLDITSTTDQIKSLNNKIISIDETLEYPDFIPILEKVISEKGPSIRFGEISYLSEGSNKASLNISGISDRRDSLVSFSERLKAVSYFKDVDLPISNLAKDRNIDFNISVNIEK